MRLQGKCGFCQKWRSLKDNGRLVWHRKGGDDCPGHNRLPETTREA